MSCTILCYHRPVDPHRSNSACEAFAKCEEHDWELEEQPEDGLCPMGRIEARMARIEEMVAKIVELTGIVLP